MTPDRADVKVLQLMIDTMVGREKFSYPARQNSESFKQPKPTGEFAHVRILGERQVGIPSQKIYTQDDNTTTYRTYGCVLLTARVGVVETTGIPSSKIMVGWTSEAMKALMIKTGYGFVRCTPLNNEDAKLEKEWEYRKGFTIELYVTRTFEEVVDNINHMTISGKYYYADEEVDLFMNIND